MLGRSVGVGSLCIAQLEQTAEVAVCGHMRGEGHQKGRGWGHLLAGGMDLVCLGLQCTVAHVLEGGIGGMIPRPGVTVDMVRCLWNDDSVWMAELCGTCGGQTMNNCPLSCTTTGGCAIGTI